MKVLFPLFAFICKVLISLVFIVMSMEISFGESWVPKIFYSKFIYIVSILKMKYCCKLKKWKREKKYTNSTIAIRLSQTNFWNYFCFSNFSINSFPVYQKIRLFILCSNNNRDTHEVFTIYCHWLSIFRRQQKRNNRLNE